MSTSHVTLKLDAGAIRALFAEPEAKLELQRAVVAEVIKQLWPNYLKEDLQRQIKETLEAAKPELLELARDEKQIGDLITQRIRSMKDNLRGSVKLGQASDEVVREVDSRIRRVIEERVNERVGPMQKQVDTAAEYVADRIERNMERWVTEAVDARIKQGINQAIDKMRAAI